MPAGEETDAQRRGRADVEVLQRYAIDQEVDDLGGGPWAATGQDLNGVERLERVDHPQQERDGDEGSQQRQR